MKTLKTLLLSLLLLSGSTHAALTDADKSLIPGIALNSNPGAELSTAGWVTYHNGTTAPSTGMTGGSMSGNITLSRTTTVGEVIDRGNASFKIVKGAASAQGDGVSTTFTFAAMPRSGLVTMPIKILSGSVVQGDIKVYCWDNTNGALITPSYNDVLGSAPITPSFPISSNTTSLTCGIHFASTSTTAVTFSYKFLVNSQTAVMGMAGSDWKSFTMGVSASTTAPTKGTVSFDVAQYGQTGDSIALTWDYYQTSAGAAGSGTYLFQLPNNYSFDASKIKVDSVHGTVIGTGQIGNLSDEVSNTTTPVTVYAYDSTHFAIRYLNAASTTNTLGAFTSGSFANFGSSTVLIHVNIPKIPIAGLSSNVTMGASSTYRISSYLANGTRVTTTPTALGQYRAYQQAASTGAGSDTAPATAPSSSNGIALGSFAYNAAGSGSFNISRYEIFIGKNKNYKVGYYASTGFSGQLAATFRAYGGSYQIGVTDSYDPSTGVLIIDALNTFGGTGGAHLGSSPGGSGASPSQVDTGYFDVIVSENALAIGIAAPRSEVHLDTWAGNGSTNTKIPYYTNSSVSGTAFLVTNSSSLGASVTILEDGLYTAGVEGQAAASGDADAGITLNESSFTTNISSITNNAIRICYSNIVLSSGDAGIASATRTKFFPAGSVLRPHTNGNTPSNNDRNRFWITKVSN